MQTIETYIVLAALVWIWETMIRLPLFMKKTVLGYKYRNNLLMWLDRKPINCGKCIAFWLGLTFFLITNQLIYLTLPLTYKLFHRYL